MAHRKSSRPIFVVGLIGLLTGGFVGFLLRPADVLGNQLPFADVITRGASMEGLESALMTTLAETSFNYLAAGAIIGLVAGVVIAYLLTRR
jgi:uncharacterized membrane-anchored protein YhcB (DUF1043 family)